MYCLERHGNGSNPALCYAKLDFYIPPSINFSDPCIDLVVVSGIKSGDISVLEFTVCLQSKYVGIHLFQCHLLFKEVDWSVHLARINIKFQITNQLGEKRKGVKCFWKEGTDIPSFSRRKKKKDFFKSIFLKAVSQISLVSEHSQMKWLPQTLLGFSLWFYLLVSLCICAHWTNSCIKTTQCHEMFHNCKTV